MQFDSDKALHFFFTSVKLSLVNENAYIYIYIYICGSLSFLYLRHLIGLCIKMFILKVYRYVDISVYLRPSSLIGLVGRVFVNCLRDLSSIPRCVLPKTLKMVLDTSLFNTQEYKVRIKGKVEQSRVRSSAFPQLLGAIAIEKGAFFRPRLRSPTLLTYLYGLK